MEKRLLPADQEFYGLVFALEHFREYLEGVKFTIKTDNSCLSRNPLWIEPADLPISFANITTKRGTTTGTNVDRKRQEYIEAKQKLQQVATQKDPVIQGQQLPVAPDDDITEEFIHPLLSDILAGYAIDKWFADIIHTQNLIKSATGLWLKADNKIQFYQGNIFNHRIVIPDAFDLRKRIMSYHHDLPSAGHRSTAATMQNIRRDFWWPGWSLDVERFCKTCNVCQQTKYRTTVPYGLLKPLQMPNRKWGSISMDFVTNLPVTSRKNDTILIVVDRLSKMAHYIPMQLKSTAEKVARILNAHVFKLHGLPDSIISDRDVRFTSNFMTELWKLWGIDQCLSTAYRPQTDGQTERVNRTLQEYLRAYVTPQGKDWEDQLPAAEFAYNDSYHASIGCTPFFLNYGCHPRSPLSVRLTNSKVPTAHQHVQIIQKNVQMARRILQRAQDRMKMQYDKHHQHVWYNVGDQVLLSTENLKLTGCPKFWPRYIGPFVIKEVINMYNYRIDIPAIWKIHDVFHVAVLKPYLNNGRFQPLQLPTVLSDDTFQVEKIVQHRQIRKGRHHVQEYLCSYADAGPESQTWEKEKDLQIAFPHLLQAYKRLHGLHPFYRRQILEEGEC